MRVTMTALIALAFCGAAHAATTPSTVANFASQLTKRCENAGGKASIVGPVTQKLNLNQDGIDDWLLDESAVVCTGGPPTGGPLKPIMLFAGAKDGDAYPVLQQGVYAYRLERGVMWVALRGSACGPKGEGDVYCDRPISWNGRAGRAELGPIAQVRVPSRLTQ